MKPGKASKKQMDRTRASSGPQRDATQALHVDIEEMLRRLEEAFPNPTTELEHDDPFQLLVATILSAQATDKGVNQVTPALFAAFPDPTSMARLEPEELHPYIGRLGLFRNKARAIVGTAKLIEERHGGEVPGTRDALMKLPGVGRKTASVVLSNAFGVPAIAVDTHVFRVSRRMGLADEETVDKVELQLMARIPEAQWSDAHHWLILHGRRVCSARKPACERCVISDLCPSSTALEVPGEA